MIYNIGALSVKSIEGSMGIDPTIFIPNNPIIIVGLVTILGILFYWATQLYIASKYFTIGPGYSNTIRKTFAVSKSKEKQIKNLSSSQEKKQKEIDFFNLTAKRMGMDIDYAENQRRIGSTIPMAVMLFSLGVIIMLMMMSLEKTLLGLLIFILCSIGSVLIPFKYNIQMRRNLKPYKNDVYKDLSRLIELFIYTDAKRGFEGTVEDFLPDSNALKVDLQMYLSDVTTYERNDALDKLNDRMNNKQFTTFCSHIKSAETLEPEQIVFSIMSLNNDVGDMVHAIMKKEIKDKYRVVTLVMLLIFTAIVLIATSDTMSIAIWEMISVKMGVQ